MDKEEWLERAIRNELSKDELLTFEQMLKEDADLKEQFIFEKKVQEGLHQTERLRLKELFEKEEKRKLFPLWIPWAAAALLVIGFSWFFWPAGPAGDHLYTSYYQKFPNVVSPITRGEIQEEDAFTEFEKGKYEDALVLLGKASGDTAHFYQIMCLLELHKYEEAFEALKSQSYDSVMDDYRLWYLSLMYLKNEDYDNAEQILNKLSQRDFPLREKAKDLLLEIK
jgi:tetratricopeptide (TPR) repeat protein